MGWLLFGYVHPDNGPGMGFHSIFLWEIAIDQGFIRVIYLHNSFTLFPCVIK
jgi:hypothetical protein